MPTATWFGLLCERDLRRCLVDRNERENHEE
jgi:hypothetical protein